MARRVDCSEFILIITARGLSRVVLLTSATIRDSYLVNRVPEFALSEEMADFVLKCKERVSPLYLSDLALSRRESSML